MPYFPRGMHRLACSPNLRVPPCRAKCQPWPSRPRSKPKHVLFAHSRSIYSTETVFVQIQVDAYILTRSVHVPAGILAATLLQTKPFSSKARMYHGHNPADRSNTRPAVLSARLMALTCAAASGPAGVNQSMLSIRTAIVSASGCIRAKTSESSSVCILRPSKALHCESLACDLGAR